MNHSIVYLQLILYINYNLKKKRGIIRTFAPVSGDKVLFLMAPSLSHGLVIIDVAFFGLFHLWQLV